MGFPIYFGFQKTQKLTKVGLHPISSMKAVSSWFIFRSTSIPASNGCGIIIFAIYLQHTTSSFYYHHFPHHVNSVERVVQRSQIPCLQAGTPTACASSHATAAPSTAGSCSAHGPCLGCGRGQLPQPRLWLAQLLTRLRQAPVSATGSNCGWGHCPCPGSTELYPGPRGMHSPCNGGGCSQLRLWAQPRLRQCA